MQRIDHSTAVAVRPAPAAAGTPGYFTGGDPATGQKATVVTADFLNMVQEELIAILTAAGVVPDKASLSQVLTALQVLFLGKNATAAAASKLATPRLINLLGDVTGGASFDGTGQVNITTTVGDDSHAHSISTIAGLQAALNALYPNSNPSGFINSNGRAYPRASSGADLNFVWSGSGGQPTWLWGGETPGDIRLYNPSVFSVNYSTYASGLRRAGDLDGSGDYSYNVRPTFDGSRWYLRGYNGMSTYHSECRVGYADLAGSVSDAGSSKVANGYVILPGSGIILQWGQVVDDGGTYSFPIAFPNACMLLVGAANWDNWDGGTSINAYVVSRSQFRMRNGGAANPTVAPNYFFAIGY